MNETSNIVPLRQPDEIDDPLTNILRAGARQLLAQAVEIEVETFLATVKDLKLADGRARVVRHGYGPARTIATGIRPVEVARAKLRDRGAAGDSERIRFSSAILPLGAAHPEFGRAVAAAVPARHLDGRFPGGADGYAGQGRAEPVAGGHLPADGRVAGRVRALAEARSVGATLRVCGADGVFLQARMEDHGECMLVLIGATPEGKKELIGLSNRRHR